MRCGARARAHVLSESLSRPLFVRLRFSQGVTYCGSSKASSLTMNNVPYHDEVRRTQRGGRGGKADDGRFSSPAGHVGVLRQSQSGFPARFGPTVSFQPVFTQGGSPARFDPWLPPSCLAVARCWALCKSWPTVSTSMSWCRSTSTPTLSLQPTPRFDAASPERGTERGEHWRLCWVAQWGPLTPGWPSSALRWCHSAHFSRPPPFFSAAHQRPLAHVDRLRALPGARGLRQALYRHGLH